VLRVLDSRWWLCAMALMTLYVVFGEELKLAAFPPSADIGLEALTIVCLGVFLAEIALSSAARPHFFLSFYFWVDLVATLSLFVEFPMIRRQVLGQGLDYYDIREEQTAEAITGAAASSGAAEGRGGRGARARALWFRLLLQLLLRTPLAHAAAAAATVVGTAALAAADALLTRPSSRPLPRLRNRWIPGPAAAQAHLASKAGRVAKGLRLLRTLQLFRLFKDFEWRAAMRRKWPSITDEHLMLMRYEPGESRVGQKLSGACGR